MSGVLIWGAFHVFPKHFESCSSRKYPYYIVELTGLPEGDTGGSIRPTNIRNCIMLYWKFQMDESWGLRGEKSPPWGRYWYMYFLKLLIFEKITKIEGSHLNVQIYYSSHSRKEGHNAIMWSILNCVFHPHQVWIMFVIWISNRSDDVIVLNDLVEFNFLTAASFCCD